MKVKDNKEQYIKQWKKGKEEELYCNIKLFSIIVYNFLLFAF